MSLTLGFLTIHIINQGYYYAQNIIEQSVYHGLRENIVKILFNCLHLVLSVLSVLSSCRD